MPRGLKSELCGPQRRLPGRLDPDPQNDFNFFAVLPDPATNQFYVWDSGNPDVFVYADRTAAIPTVSEWGMVCMALVLLTVGKIVFHQRPGSVSTAAFGGFVDDTSDGSERKALHGTPAP